MTGDKNNRVEYVGEVLLCGYFRSAGSLTIKYNRIKLDGVMIKVLIGALGTL